MRGFIAAIFAIGALASPALVKKDCDDVCMTPEEGAAVANNFKTLIASYSDDLAEEYMTEDFEDYSDSVETLINSGCPNGPVPLGSVTFPSRAAFEIGQGGQPAIPFEILNLWYSCEGPVVIRWRSAMTPEIVTGNIVIETVRGNGTQPWLISKVFSEFNSGAWLVNLGVFSPVCASSNSTAAAKSKRSLPLRML